MKIESVRDLVHDQPQRVDAMLGDVLEGVVDAVAEVRRVAHDLRPRALDELGLAGAVRPLADADRRRLSGHPGGGRPAHLPSLPAAVEVAAYYIVGEAPTTNVARHSRAGYAVVALRVAGGELKVSVRDDGCGPGTATPGGVEPSRCGNGPAT